jgi:hypothetical protein
MVGPLRARKGSKSGIHSYSTSVSGWAPEGPKVCQFKGLNSTLMLVVGKDRCGGCVPSDALRCVHAPATDKGAAAATARLVARRGGVLRERALVVTPPRTRPQSAARRRRTQLSDRRGSTRTRFDDCQSWDADRAHRSGPPTYGNGRQRTPFRVRLLTVTVGNVNGRVPHTSAGRVQSWTGHASPTIRVSSALTLSTAHELDLRLDARLERGCHDQGPGGTTPAAASRTPALGQPSTSSPGPVHARSGTTRSHRRPRTTPGGFSSASIPLRRGQLHHRLPVLQWVPGHRNLLQSSVVCEWDLLAEAQFTGRQSAVIRDGRRRVYRVTC